MDEARAGTADPYWSRRTLGVSHAPTAGTARWNHANWSNMELGFEYNDDLPLVRFYLGYGRVLNEYDRCDRRGDDEACDSAFGIGYAGVSLGWRVL